MGQRRMGQPYTDSKLPWGPLFFWGVKEAYMSIDANHISNPKDR